MMGFRHYHGNFNKANPSWGFSFWGYNIKAPTLDIMLGKHAFVIFWKKGK
jgi:hypothetical protein